MNCILPAKGGIQPQHPKLLDSRFRGNDSEDLGPTLATKGNF